MFYFIFLHLSQKREIYLQLHLDALSHFNFQMNFFSLCKYRCTVAELRTVCTFLHTKDDRGAGKMRNLFLNVSLTRFKGSPVVVAASDQQVAEQGEGAEEGTGEE